MENVIFESNRIRVRKLSYSDIPIITRWWNDGMLMKDMGFINGMGVTESSLLSRFEKQLSDDDAILESRMFIITDIKTGKEIGELQYGELDLKDKKCRIAIKISEISYQGKGLGEEALSLFIDYLVSEFGLNKIEIDTIHDNIRAYNLYKKLGFKEVERIKDYWTDDQGIKHDIIFMEKIIRTPCVEVKFYDTVDDNLLKFAVIGAKHRGKWVFCKHKERDTYECPGGHREKGEAILETAKRELWEETGATKFDLKKICVYSVSNDNKETFGMLYYAEIQEFKELPMMEMEKIELFDGLPEIWTYPLIQPKLIRKIQTVI